MYINNELLIKLAVDKQLLFIDKHYSLRKPAVILMNKNRCIRSGRIRSGDSRCRKSCELLFSLKKKVSLFRKFPALDIWLKSSPHWIFG